MNAAFVAEIFVMGLLPFCSLFFLVSAVFGMNICDLSKLSQLKDFSALVGILVTVAIYILGAIWYPLCDKFNRKSLENTRFLGRLFKPVLNSCFGRSTYNPENHQDNFFYVFHKGTDNLIRAINVGGGLLAIVKSVSLSLPLLAISLAVWLLQIQGWNSSSVWLILKIWTLLSALEYISMKSFMHEGKLQVKRFKDAKAFLQAEEK